jgi:hypothetical protein
MCVKDNVSFLAIFDARSNYLPDGDAYKAWNNLQDNLKPVSLAKKHEFNRHSIKNLWIKNKPTQMTGLQNWNV